jgi:hypothetical protein
MVNGQMIHIKGGVRVGHIDGNAFFVTDAKGSCPKQDRRRRVGEGKGRGDGASKNVRGKKRIG